MRMSAIDRLINYIMSLTPEQAEELATLIDSLTDNQKEYIKRIVEVLKDCNDIDLLDLIFKIAVKSVSAD